MTVAQSTIADFSWALAQRTPTPGGGAAAAVAAALGCASAAMAAHYATTGRFAGVATLSLALIEQLDQARNACLDLADQDAAAYAEVCRTRAAGADDTTRANALRAAQEVPLRLLKTCSIQCTAILGYLPDGNPQLRSDLAVAIHLLAGAGRAAWQTLLVNQPDPAMRSNGQEILAELARCEQSILASGP